MMQSAIGELVDGSARRLGTVVFNAAVSSGMTLLLLQRPEERNVLEAMEQHRAAILYGVPWMYLALLNLSGKFLRTNWSGASRSSV